MASGRLPVGSGSRRARAERILDAAAELLARHGYRRVSVDDVAVRAGVGKGTVYLHWATREALFWTVLQREGMRLLDTVMVRLGEDTGLALPHRLMPAIFLEVQERPLVRALLLSDAEVLGVLAADESVAVAQRELAGSPDYLDLLARRGLLRAGLSPTAAGHILGAIMLGFFSVQESDDHSDDEAALPAEQRARLLADVLERSLLADAPACPDAAAALSADVRALFQTITAVQRAQLEQAY